MNLLSSLEYFLAVAEHASFTRAADHLGIAQPPVSRRVADLEKHLGVKLFDRSRRRIELTTAGRSLLAEATEILWRVENLPKVARPRTEDYFVGVVGNLDPEELANVESHLRVADTQVRLVPESLATLDGRIAAGGLEAGLIVGELGGNMSKFSSKVATDMFVEIGVASRQFSQMERLPSVHNQSTESANTNSTIETQHKAPKIDVRDLRGMPAGMDLSRIASLTEREKILVLPEDSGLLDDYRLLTPLVKQGIHLRQLELAESEFAAVAHAFSHESVLLCSEFLAKKNSLPYRRLNPPIFAKRVYAIGTRRFDLLSELAANSAFERALASVLGATTNLQHQPHQSIRESYPDERLHRAK